MMVIVSAIWIPFNFGEELPVLNYEFSGCLATGASCRACEQGVARVCRAAS